jgi:hypothetical protein
MRSELFGQHDKVHAEIEQLGRTLDPGDLPQLSSVVWLRSHARLMVLTRKNEKKSQRIETFQTLSPTCPKSSAPLAGNCS